MDGKEAGEPLLQAEAQEARRVLVAVGDFGDGLGFRVQSSGWACELCSPLRQSVSGAAVAKTAAGRNLAALVSHDGK